MNKHNFYNLKIKTPYFIIGLLSTIFTILSPTPREGLELIWLVPFSFTLCAIIFGSIVQYHKGGVGLKILYIIILIRYVLSPILITLTHGYTNYKWIEPSIESYQFSIFISIFELFICCFSIKYFWKKLYNKQNNCHSEKFRKNESLTIGGLFVGLILIIISLSRGVEGIKTSFGFLLLEAKYDSGYIDFYSIIMIQVLKSFLYISIVSWAYINYSKRKQIIFPIIAFIAAFINISIYFGYNRSLIVQTAIASIFILIYAFPKFKKSIFLSLIPISFVIIYSLVTIKQFGVGVQNFNLKETISIEEISNIIESYVNGFWSLGSSYDASSLLGKNISIYTPIKDTIDNFFLFKIPGFLWVNNFVSEINSTIYYYQIYTYPLQGAMLPLAGQMYFYGGFYFGPILTMISYIIVYYFLVKVEIISKKTTNIQSKFLYSWLASLFGLIMCYCLITLWWSISKFAFFLIILFILNNNIKIKKRFKLRNEYSLDY